MNGIATAFTATVVRPAECLVARSSGKTYIKLRAIVDEHGAGVEQRQFVNVLAFGEQANDELASKLGKGAEIYVEGRLRLEHWATRAGEPRTDRSVLASRLEPLGRIGRRSAALEASEQRHLAEKAALQARLDRAQQADGPQTFDDDVPR